MYENYRNDPMDGITYAKWFKVGVWARMEATMINKTKEVRPRRTKGSCCYLIDCKQFGKLDRMSLRRGNLRGCPAAAIRPLERCRVSTRDTPTAPRRD